MKSNNDKQKYGYSVIWRRNMFKWLITELCKLTCWQTCTVQLWNFNALFNHKGMIPLALFSVIQKYLRGIYIIYWMYYGNFIFWNIPKKAFSIYNEVNFFPSFCEDMHLYILGILCTIHCMESHWSYYFTDKIYYFLKFYALPKLQLFI